MGTIALYCPATRHDFVNYDDTDYVTLNPQVQAALTPASLKWSLTAIVSGNWHPVTLWSHMLDCQVFHLAPWGHHLDNVLLHALNTALVFLLFLRLTGAAWRSAIVAALFAVHPLHVESVAWVAERKDVLSACLGLISLVCYASYASKAGGARAAWFYAASLISFALGLLSKPMLVTWPFLMLVLDFWPLKRMTNFPSLVIEKIPFFALTVALSVVTFVVQQHAGMMVAVRRLPLDERLENALVSYGRYLEKLFRPTGLAVFYPYPGHWPWMIVLLSVVLLFCITVLCLLERRRRPYFLTGWFWFVGTLVPVIGLVQVGAQAMADRYTYLPSLGIFIMVVWGVSDLVAGRQGGVAGMAVAGSLALAACVCLTERQLSCWQNSETLFRQALRVTEGSDLAHYNLGCALDDQGRTEEAMFHYQEALRFNPDDADAHYNLGNALDKQGHGVDAAAQFQEAVRLRPDFAEAHNNLGNALSRQGLVNDAIKQYREAIRLKPDYPLAHSGLAAILFAHGQMVEAAEQYRAAVDLQPSSAPDHNGLASVLYAAGNVDEAMNEYREAIRLDPAYAYPHVSLGLALEREGRKDEGMAEYREAIRLKPDFADPHNYLGVALARTGHPDEALSELQAAIRLNPQYAAAHNNLGMIYMRSGRVDEAASEFQEALRLQPDYAVARKNLDRALEMKGPQQ